MTMLCEPPEALAVADAEHEDVGKPKDCVFCRIAAGSGQPALIYQDADFLAFLHLAPVAPGHAVLVTRSHFPAINAAPPAIQGRMMQVANMVAVAIARGVNADGFNLLVANGTCAGQLVRHAHLEIIPRSPLDGLALPPVGMAAPSPDQAARLIDTIRRRLADET